MFDVYFQYLSQSEDVAGVPVLVDNVERYAAYVADAIVNDNIDTGNVTAILLNRTHIGEVIQGL